MKVFSYEKYENVKQIDAAFYKKFDGMTKEEVCSRVTMPDFDSYAVEKETKLVFNAEKYLSSVYTHRPMTIRECNGLTRKECIDRGVSFGNIDFGLYFEEVPDFEATMRRWRKEVSNIAEPQCSIADIGSRLNEAVMIAQSCKLEWSPKYGELVEVSDDGRNWSKAYYVGNLIDRSKKYMTVEKKDEVYMFTCDCIRKVDLWPKMRKYEKVVYRSYENNIEATQALGRKVIIGWCTVYGHKKPDYRCIYLADNCFKVFINGSYRNYSFEKAFRELKFNDGTPIGVKL